MFKKLVYVILSLMALLYSNSSQAQTGGSIASTCGTTSDYISTLGVPVDYVSVPSPFPAAAQQACGKFMIYYYDKAYHPGEGFDDPTLGATRRNTLCAVLTYIQSVYDFSSIPSGKYIRLRVDTSYTHTYHSPTLVHPLGYGAPFYKVPITAGSIVDGYVLNYLRSGSDPDTNSFHCDLRINFDSVRATPKYTLDNSGTKTIAVDYQNGLGNVANCQFDLYSNILHLISHSIGYLSMHGPTTAYSTWDTSLRTGTNPISSSTAFTGTLVSYWSSWGSSLGAVWMDNSPAPYRISPEVIDVGHLRTDYLGSRFNSGAYQPHVMNAFLGEGIMRRSYTKEELRIGKDIIRHNFNSSIFAGSSTSAFYYNNHRPYCSKNFDLRYNDDFFEEGYYFDTLQADFSIINNTGVSLSINLASDTTLHDDDGDSLHYIPESIVNYRGCGMGGNNHNLLTLSNGNRTITYTPRPNFYGRAQFTVNISDGKEEGTMVLYTIDVAKGNQVNISYGNNLVLNGDFEEGSEVRLKDTAEEVGALTNDWKTNYNPHTGIRNSNNFADCQPYSNGVAIRNSYAECSETTKVKYAFGFINTSFPWAWDSIGGPSCYQKNPEAYLAQGNRYQNTYSHSLYNLGDSVRQCNNYLLEMDVIYTGSSSCSPYLPVDTVYISFTDGSHIIKTAPRDAYSNFTLPPYPVKGLGVYGWKHLKIPISYCSDTPSNILHIHIASTAHSGSIGCGSCGWLPSHDPGAFVLVDNVSLKQQAFAVNIIDTLISPCITRLFAEGTSINACGTGMSYQWKNLSTGKVIDSNYVVDVSPHSSTSYEVTVTNGCSVAKDTVLVAGSSCPCSPADVFGDTVGFYSMSGTIASIPVHSHYYITANTTLSKNSTFKNANVLIAPNVTFTVSDSVLLTLDSAHLYTCPTDTFMWRGIVLASGASKSGRIMVKNNSMIEDALFAIDALTLRRPASGYIISSENSVYNRNQVDISLNNYRDFTDSICPFRFLSNVFTARQIDHSNFVGYPNIWPSARYLKTPIVPATDTKPSFVLSRNYPKALRKDHQFSLICVRINNAGFTNPAGNYLSEVVIGGGITNDTANFFDNHGYGILSYNSNTFVQNGTFINISKRMYPEAGSSTSPMYNGMGIIGLSDSLNKNRLKVKETATSFNVSNRFHDCYNGIYTEGLAESDISTANFTSSHNRGGTAPGAATIGDSTGANAIVVVTTKSYVKGNASSNTISNLHNGIGWYYMAAPTTSSTNISNNKIYARNPVLGTGLTANQYVQLGISAYMGIDKAATATLVANNNLLDSVYNGIFFPIYGNTRPTAQDNFISLRDAGNASNAQYGIRFSLSYNGLIQGNKIQSKNLISDYIRGVGASFTTSLKICGNTTLNIGRGFEFGDKRAQVGTRWIGNTMTNGYKGMVLASDIDDQGLMYDYVKLFPPTFWGATGNKWAGTWGGGSAKYQTVATDSINTMHSKLWVKNVVSGTSELPTINTAVPGGMPFPYKYDYLGATRSILATTKVANCEGALMPIKYNPIPQSSFSTAKMLGHLIIADSLGYDDSYKASQWMAQLSLYELAVLDPELRDSSALLDSFMIAAANSRYAWLTNIEKALGNEDIGSAQALLNTQTQGLGRVVVNGDLIITDYPEADYVVANYTDYYNVYLHYLQGTLDASDTATLISLAAKCPARDGAAVYKARNLYTMFTHSNQEYNDEDCANNNGGQYRKEDPNAGLSNSAQQYALYPNPNEGKFILRQSVIRDEQVAVALYNGLGMLMAKENVLFRNGMANFNIGTVSAGLYLICIQDAQQQNICLKFNVK
jgi:hypothetical protein